MSMAPRTFTINGIVVDLAGRALRDRDGSEIALRPQAFDMLAFLIANAGRLVGKDELMRTLWPNVFVTDDSLVQCVRDIRRALRDDDQSVLKAVPKRGYRLEIPAARPPLVSARQWRAASAAGLAVAALVAAGAVWRFSEPADAGAESALPSVAVLPFSAIGGKPEDQLLARGVTEDIITDLAGFPEFRIIASNTSEAFAANPAAPGEAGAALDAGFIVEGSIQRQAERLRITAQLIEAASGKHLWSDRWDRPDDDLFAIQSEIAEQVSNRLGGGAGLIQEAGRREAHRKPPANLNAYELYLLGTEKLEQINREDVEEAIRLLTRAVELDPTLARAWVELYHSHCTLATFEVEPANSLRLAADAAKRAVTLDPGDAEAHAVYAMSVGNAGDLPRARAEFDTALTIGPNQFEILTFYVGWASRFGEPERGAAMADHAIRLNPNYPMWSTRFFNFAYFMVGRYEDALRMQARMRPDNYGRWVWTLRPASLAAAGRVDEARSQARQALERFPDLTIEGFASSYPTAAERKRLVETMRLAGFPPCARPEALAKFEDPVRLPECAAH